MELTIDQRILKWANAVPFFSHLVKRLPVGRVFSGLLWIGIGNSVSAVSLFISGLCLAKVMGAAKYGQFSVIQSALAMFVLFTGPSLGAMSTKYVAELGVVNPRKAAAILKLSTFSAAFLSILASLLMILVAPYLSVSLLKAPELKMDFMVSAITLLFSGVSSVQIGALYGFEAFREIAILNILRGILTLILVSLGGYYYGVHGAIIGVGLAMMAVCVQGSYYVRGCNEVKKFPSPTYKEMFQEKGLLLSFSLPNWVYAIVASGVNLVTYMIVSRSLEGFREMGVFNAANQFFLILNFVPTIIAQVAFPVLSSITLESDFGRMRKGYYLHLMSTLGVILFSLCVLIPISRNLMSSLGGDFGGHTLILVMTLITSLFYAASNVAWQAMLILGKAWATVAFVALYASVYIGVFYVSSSVPGAYSLAVGRLVAYVAYATMALVYVEILFRGKRKPWGGDVS